MIDVIKQQLPLTANETTRINKAREILQVLALKILSDKGHFKSICFVGGTALRVLHNTGRFSENLDFSLSSGVHYNFDNMLKHLHHEFALFDIPVEAKPIKKNLPSTVDGSMLKFQGLLYKLGLSPLKSQVLSVKIEVDTRPPAGWISQNTLVTKMYMFYLSHWDLASLFATKLHACFYRTFVKGRDFYDLAWYVSNKIKPNFLLLNNAIKQTQGTDPGITEATLKDFIISNLKRIDFSIVHNDVDRFVDDKSELAVLRKDLISETIERAY